MSVSAFCIKLVQNIFLSDEDLLLYTGDASIKACMSSCKVVIKLSHLNSNNLTFFLQIPVYEISWKSVQPFSSS